MYFNRLTKQEQNNFKFIRNWVRSINRKRGPFWQMQGLFGVGAVKITKKIGNIDCGFRVIPLGYTRKQIKTLLYVLQENYKIL